MSRQHKDFKKANALLPTKTEQEAAIESIAVMFPPDFKWVARALLESLDFEKLSEGWCFKCDGPGRLRHPDFAQRHKTIELLLAHKIGKPTERKVIDINTKVELVRENLEQLSDAELVQLAEAEDAQWKPLPPAA